jgi:hypothetical protein
MAIAWQGKFADKNRPATEQELRAFAQEAIAGTVGVRRALDQQSAAFKEQNFLNLSELSIDKDNLKKVKKGLEQMQAEPQDAAQIAAWFNFLKETKTKYDELNAEKQPAAAQK